jgi:hypothetical protein
MVFVKGVCGGLMGFVGRLPRHVVDTGHAEAGGEKQKCY